MMAMTTSSSTKVKAPKQMNRFGFILDSPSFNDGQPVLASGFSGRAAPWNNRRDQSKPLAMDEFSIAAKKFRQITGLALPHYHPTLAEIWTYPAEELAEQIG
jgi:hypothetical protein